MRRNVRRRQTKTRSIQRSVQLLLILSGIAFLLAGLVLAASGASVDSAFGSVSDRLDDSSQPADGGTDSADDGTAGDGSGNESDGSGDETDGGGSDGSDGGGGDGEGDGSGDGTGETGSETGSENDSDTDETHDLTAVVETQDGEPIEDATVTVDGPDVSVTKSAGDDGEVTFERPDGEYTVTATADGYRSDTEESVVIDGSDPETVTLELEEEDGGETYSLGGTVVDENGTPVSNASVAIEGANGVDTEMEVNDDGTFEFTNLQPGDYQVSVIMDGEESTTEQITISDSDRDDLELTVQRSDGDNSDGGDGSNNDDGNSDDGGGGGTWPFIVTPGVQ